MRGLLLIKHNKIMESFRLWVSARGSLKTSPDFLFRNFFFSWQKKSPACRCYDIKKDLTLTGISGSPRRRRRLGMKREIVVYTVDYWLSHILPEVRKTCFTLARPGMASDLVNVTAHRCGGGSGPDKCVSSPSTERRRPADKDLHVF